MPDANLLSRLRRKIGLMLGKEDMPSSPANMTDKDIVAQKWGIFAEHRAAIPQPKVDRVFSMDHPVVQEYVYDTYLNGQDPFEYVGTFLPRVPCEFGLEIGCGSGQLSINLVKEGICRHIDAFDVSEQAIEIGRETAKEEEVSTIRFDVADANSIFLAENKYDFVYMCNSLHHVEKLEHLYEQVNNALTEDGIFFANDYVGPTRMQWTEKQMEIMNAVLSLLPDRYRRSSLKSFRIRKEIERLPVETYERIDPSEGVRSAEILPLAKERLDIIEIRPLGSSIIYELFYGMIHNFDENSDLDTTLLRLICLLESTLIREGALESDFACFIAKKRR